MTLRIATLLAATLVLLAAPGAWASHHEGKGKGQAKAAEKAAQAEAARERGEAEARAGEAARGDEMRARRDERKVVMEEAKGAAEPGTPRKGKKPWWRFWESDDDGAGE